MASLREYFDGDFSYAARVCISLRPEPVASIEAAVLYDFSAMTAFIACYVPGARRELPFFIQVIEAIHSKSEVQFDGKVVLPSGRNFPGQLEVQNTNPFDMRAQFFGDPEWVSIRDIRSTSRIFIYSESSLSEDDVVRLKQRGRELEQRVQFRSPNHAEARSRFESPLAFISHDTRDKEAVARKIAMQLQRMMCPVWYDEFSLKVGANLRDNIEKGLKTCKKCILVLSHNFFSNRGWTKKEFDSIFTREILEKTQVVLPVWYGVTSAEVYDYSPSLLNVKGIDWRQLGEDEACRQLCQVILDQER